MSSPRRVHVESKTQEAVPSKRATEPEKESDKKKKDEPTASFFSLFRFADRVDGVLYTIGIIGGIVNGLTMPAFSVVFGEMLDGFNPGEPGTDIMADVSKYAVIITLVGVLSWIAAYIEIACFTIASERQAAAVRDAYFSALLRQDIGWYDAHPSEELVTKVADETRALKEGLGAKLGLAVRSIATFIGGFIVAFMEGWQLTLLLMTMVPLMAVAGAIWMKMMANLESASSKAYAKAGALAQELLAGAKTVQTFGGQKDGVRRYGVFLDSSRKAGVKSAFVQGASMGFTNLIMFGTYGLAFWFGSRLIAEDREDVLDELAAAGCGADPDFSITCSPSYLNATATVCVNLCNDVVFPCLGGTGCHTGGQVVLVFFAVIIGAIGIGQATPSGTSVAQAQVAGYKVFEVLDREVSIVPSDDPSKKVRREDVRGNLVFNDVSFSYPSRPERKVLDGLNLTIEAGTTVALVGRSGCGKSTIVSLIQRFYDPDSGTVSLDDLGPLTELDVESVRSVMGLVGQEPVLFDNTIRDNIKLGAVARNVTDAEVEEVARMANAHHFISEFEKGYDTIVGERGTSLSGGQKQRVAIARAIVRRPKILLLDEATSALDSNSEVAVQAALDVLMNDHTHTTVVIAHRLSTIKNADKIVVMHQGRVIEQGKHDELMAIPDGTYRDLVEAQQSGRDGKLADLSDHMNESEEKQLEGKVQGSAGARSVQASAQDTAGGDEETKDAGDTESKVDTSVLRILRMSAFKAGWILIGMLGALVYGTQYPMFSLAFAEIVNLFFEPKISTMRSDGEFWSIMFLILGFVSCVAALLMFGAFGLVGAHLTRKLRGMAFNALLHKDMAFLDKKENSTGVLTTQLATDASQVNSLAAERMGRAATNVVTCVTGLTIAFQADWRLSLVVLACLPLIALSGHYQMKAFSGQSSAASASLEKAGQVVEESVHGIRTVTSFNMAGEMRSRHKARLAEPRRTGIKGAHIAGVAFGFSLFIMLAVYGLAFYVGGLWVDDGSLSFKDMLLVLMAIMMTGMGFGEMSSMAPDTAKAAVAVKNIFTILDRPPQIDCTGQSAGRRLPQVQGDVVFDNIQFKYPTRSGTVIEGVTLRIAAGSQVAFVGSSGCGKSTLLQLLQRFYDPVSGCVYVDGHDVRTLDCQWLRGQIGVVSQEPTLFNGTVLENIQYGLVVQDDAEFGPLETVHLIASDEGSKGPDEVVGSQQVPARVLEAARAANAHDFICRMPEGYMTVIKPDSVSGGQRQRLAIARAILRNPRILLLDEATSALDNRSEKVVQDALDRLMAGGNRTTLVVAHRLSTIYRADQIVVLQKGRIIEQGTHEFLLGADAPVGKYREMWEQQSLVQGTPSQSH